MADTTNPFRTIIWRIILQISALPLAMIATPMKPPVMAAPRMKPPRWIPLVMKVMRVKFLLYLLTIS